ncbi:hypothetical protein KR222_001399 [Zaprionus bogoriensis]|nr:hypothetical protein KR222_001399 [Zaprionus bogoriensis]
MARSGYCSNEQIMKLAHKRYKHHLFVVYTPFMMYMEEYIAYLQEHAIKHDFSMSEIAEMARHNWKRIKKCDKVRYKELAELANTTQ